MASGMSASYAAGYFDGEGCVYIASHKKEYSLIVEIGNTRPEALFKIREVWGGSVREAHKRPNERRRWTWRISAQSAQKFLEDIRPHIIGKSVEVWLALEFQAHRTRAHLRYPLTTEQLALREGFKLALIQYRKDN